MKKWWNRSIFLCIVAGLFVGGGIGCSTATEIKSDEEEGTVVEVDIGLIATQNDDNVCFSWVLPENAVSVTVVISPAVSDFAEKTISSVVGETYELQLHGFAVATDYRVNFVVNYSDNTTAMTAVELNFIDKSAIDFGSGNSVIPTMIAIDTQAAATREGVVNSNGDVEEVILQGKLDEFDIENDVAPYVIAIADKNTTSPTGQIWHLFYGAAAGNKSGTVAYNSTFVNGFDAVNYAMSKLLPSPRSTKYKVRVDSDLYSGDRTSAIGYNSATGRTDYSTPSGTAYIYAIDVPSNTILDFNDKTLYATCEDASAIVPISLTRATNVSVRNLKLKGPGRYGIWAQAVKNAVFDNISLDMDNAGGVGLRIADRLITAWSENVYVDNITATNCQDNAVETMKVDGIWIGTITATDCNDCALLLNTTTNAVVGTVTGIRCSPRSSSGVYAALRCANFVGPNVHIHKITAEDCGHGFFSVSANHGITIDEIESTNSYAQNIFVQDTQNLLIKKATLTKTKSGRGDKAVEFADGSAGGKLAIMNNTFMNFTITGYQYGFFDHDKGVSDYINVTNCTFNNVSKDYTLYGEHNSIGQSASQSTASGAFNYTIDDDGILTKVTGSDTTAHIPNGVTAIGDSVFRGCTTLEAVTLPESVQVIGEAAFYGCTALRSVTIPASVTEIGTNAFYGCTALAAVTFNEGLKTINNCAFGLTKALTSVEIPSTVTTFGHNLFYESMEMVTIGSTDVTKMGNEAFFNLSDNSTITFTGLTVSRDNLYHESNKNASYGDWGSYWYGYTRTTIRP